jgi:hypothetical protein
MTKFVCLQCHATDRPCSKKRDLCQACFDRLAPAGLAWCARGKHRVKVAAMGASPYFCKACERARQAAFRAAHPHYHRDWQRRNQERYRAMKRRWYIGMKRRAFQRLWGKAA